PELWQNQVALPLWDTGSCPGCPPSRGGASAANWLAAVSDHWLLRCGWGRGTVSLLSLACRLISGSVPLQLDEEEERRKRRREKNKVAAARCRNKKKERTEFLQRESERLELMNAELKTQIEELKQEGQHLILMLTRHRPTCIVRTDSVKTPESEGNPLLEQLEKK
ncbi:Jun dimerization protein 2, partial [Heterocephalus glaber]